jgi:hypothetical protein
MLVKSYVPAAAARAANARSQGGTPRSQPHKNAQRRPQRSGGPDDGDLTAEELTEIGGSKVSDDTAALLAEISRLVDE